MNCCDMAWRANVMSSLRRCPRRQLQRMASCLSIFVCSATLCVTAASTVAMGSQLECTNEALRFSLNSSYLPDCRAYEMVSPAYKEGYPLFVKSFASSGNSAIVDTLGTLSGDQGSSESPAESSLYLGRRTAAGWRLTPLNASLSEFVGQLPVAAEADHGLTLWDQHTPAQPAIERGLYIRSPSGVFSYVGPLRPGVGAGEPSNVVDLNPFPVDLPKAATSDYDHVVLEARYPEGRWPFDETVVNPERQHSLYEYSGINNHEPVLVGVEGEKASDHLVARCGTTLGSGSLGGSTYNALSDDGEKIFFTVDSCSPGPATAEVYARLHGALTSPLEAETIDVSASECSISCGNESGKNFEGASDDGQQVYFTSTQKLTNDAIDGTTAGDAAEAAGCGETPAGGGGCNLYRYSLDAPAGARLEVVSVGAEVLGVVGIARDGSRIYYVSRNALASAGENVYNKLPVKGQPNLYAYAVESGKTDFITTLDAADGFDWRREFNRPIDVAGHHGRFLLFASRTPAITPDDNSTQTQLFEYQAPEEGAPAELVRVTKGEGGFNEDGNGATMGVALLSIVTTAHGEDFKSTTNTLKIAGDGRTVFFLDRGQLSPRATSSVLGCKSLYEFHESGVLSEGNVHLVSDGRDTQSVAGECGPTIQGIDTTGADVLFVASDPLLPSDGDGVQADIYDARVDGGFDLTPGAGSCGTCEGVPRGPSGASVVGSASEGGEGPVVARPGTSGHARSAIRVDKSSLARALRACRHKRGARRASCERLARRRLRAKVGRDSVRRAAR